MKILTILGARPQFIKAGSISREIKRQRKLGRDIKEVIIHTGQHYDKNMSDIFFKEMHIPKPNYSLGIGDMSHGAMTARMIEKIEEILIKEKPDYLVVYGDTNSTLAGAIAASKLHIKIVHIEAGLRSFNMKMPEEINRILTDHVSSFLFCPTPLAIDHLKNEGLDNSRTRILMSGDVMYDGVLFYRKLARKPVGIENIDSFLLCTIHRAENTNDSQRLINIINALNKISLKTQVVLPIHPRTRKILDSIDCKLSTRVQTIDPVGYLNMMWLVDKCSVVITDSGGLQKEAFFFEKPCITLRDETEWLELVNHGFNTLVGANYEKIITAYQNLETPLDFNMKLYGEGDASNKIIKELLIVS